MALTQAVVNEYSFSEVTENDKQPLITNGLGRDVLASEFIFQDGYFGEVKEYDGILDGATGRININADRTVRTAQIEVTDTFTVGNVLWFAGGGSSAAGKLVDADNGDGVQVGIITGSSGSAGSETYVEFRPYVQLISGVVASLEAEPKVLVVKVTADASTPLPIVGLSEGDEIIGVSVIATVANASGTLILEDGVGGDISDGIICAVDKVVKYAGTIDDAKSILPATGAAVISVGGTAASTRGIMIITYIPA